MILSVLAAAFTFTATATGVEKGTALEFAFAEKDSDRDYETMFLVDKSIDAFCREIEKAGLKRGRPVERRTCRLWPTGCPVKISPPLDDFIRTDMPEGRSLGDVIYTGGIRGTNDVPEASFVMPKALFALYTLDQAPFVFNGIYDQGEVYGSHLARKTLKKGERISFTLSWDEAATPRSLEVSVKPSNASDIIKTIKERAEKGEVDVLVGFDPTLTVSEAVTVANALSIIDSVRVKINGCRKDELFYRAFLPLTKWLDRKERLVQPFELTLGSPDKLLFIEEDWTVEGTDPKLTEREISFLQAREHTKTDTCFIFASANTQLKDIYQRMKLLQGTGIVNWYVFGNK